MLDKKKFYINGEWVDPKNPNNFEVINPSTEEVCAIINLGSSDDTNNAVKAAKKAFETWKETSKEERLKLLEKNLTVIKKIILNLVDFYLSAHHMVNIYLIF